MPSGVYPHKGHPITKETRKKISLANSNEKHGSWKGNKVKYNALHDWIKRKLGIVKYCEHCKRTDKKKYEWSNKDHKYRRVLSDWQRLCTSCHKRYDYSNHISNISSRGGIIKNKF